MMVIVDEFKPNLINVIQCLWGLFFAKLPPFDKLRANG